MEKYRIAVIPGDGIGPEVLTEGMKLLKTVSVPCRTDGLAARMF